MMGVRLLTVAVVLAVAGTATAAPAKPTKKDPALELFEDSATAYREGRFQDAVDKLLEARRIKPEPVLLYNLARAYEALGKWTEAADAYVQYLEEEPNAADRKALEAKVTTLRAQAAELAAARKPDVPPPPPPPSPPKKEEEPTSVVPWIVAGAGVAVVGGGLVLGVLAKGKHDDATTEPVQTRAVDLQDGAQSLATMSTITIIAGAIVAAAGVSWIAYRAASAPKRSAAILSWSF